MKAVSDRAGGVFSAAYSRRPAGQPWSAALTRPERGHTVHGRKVPAWLQALLRVSLAAKLVGANLILLVAATATAIMVRHQELGTASLMIVVASAFVLALVLNIALVMLAVHPLRILERTVDTIWHGDLAARVPVSILADRHVTRVARMFNILLDGLVSDRARTRRLAAELISATDKERAAMSRELHDSAAQSLAALVMQLGAAARAADDTPPDVLRQRIEAARALATNTLEEIRLLAHTVHPRVLDDLGLIAALKRLARDTVEVDDSMAVWVAAEEGSDARIPGPIKSVLYRVAQESVQNARRHAASHSLEIRLRTDATHATLEIVDDGRGFHPQAVADDQTGIGLFTMRERVALVDGEFSVRSAPGTGTSIAASVPLQPPAYLSTTGVRA